MNRIRLTMQFVMIVLCFSSCIEDMGVFYGEDKTFLVQGGITNLPGPHTIKLAMTRKYNEASDFSEVDGANVEIIDLDGNSITLIGQGQGAYETSESFIGEIGNSYKLMVELKNGMSYESSFEELVQAPQLDNILYSIEQVEELSSSNVIIDKTKVIIRADFCDDPDQENFYRWRYIETFEVLAPLAGGSSGAPSFNRRCGRVSPMRNCWAKRFDLEYLNIEDDSFFNGEEVKGHEVFVTDIDRKFDLRYSVEVFLASMSKEAYEYLLAIKNQIGNNGTIFETSNYQIRGNVFSLDNKNELVLGYFTASTTTSSRLFMDQNDLPYVHEYICEPNNIGCVPAACLDCRQYSSNSTNVRPDYWPL